MSCVVLLQPPEEWTGGVGFVSKEMIQAHCPAPAPDIKVPFKRVFNFILKKKVNMRIIL